MATSLSRPQCVIASSGIVAVSMCVRFLHPCAKDCGIIFAHIHSWNWNFRTITVAYFNIGFQQLFDFVMSVLIKGQ